MKITNDKVTPSYNEITGLKIFFMFLLPIAVVALITELVIYSCNRELPNITEVLVIVGIIFGAATFLFLVITILVCAYNKRLELKFITIFGKEKILEYNIIVKNIFKEKDGIAKTVCENISFDTKQKFDNFKGYTIDYIANTNFEKYKHIYENNESHIAKIHELETMLNYLNKYLIQKIILDSKLKIEKANNYKLRIIDETIKKEHKLKKNNLDLMPIIPEITFYKLTELYTSPGGRNSYEYSFYYSYSKLQNYFINFKKICDSGIHAIDGMNPYDFEYFVADIYRRNRYTCTVTKARGDDGVDIIAEKDNIKYAISCKLYSNNIGNEAVQTIIGGSRTYGCQHEIIVTNSYFTQQAIKQANTCKVTLVDRDALIDLIVDLK